MHGIAAASPARCRYLEIGCGDASNLLPLAQAWPGSQFVGIDMSGVAIARGEQLRRQLGLDNLHLQVADLTTWTPPAPDFDYICAHGFYSWVPDAVRDALLALCRDHLTGNGVAYISYNTLPGCHIRRMFWQMLRFHTRDVADPHMKIRQAVALLRFLEHGVLGDGPYAATVRHEVESLIAGTDPAVLFHDDLAQINEPVSITDFAAHAARFGMRFLAEADYSEMAEDVAPDAIAGMLAEMATRDVLLKEQYLDFLKGRRFRQTLLCRAVLAPHLRADPAALDALQLCGEIDSDPDPIDPAPGAWTRFSNRAGSALRVDAPVPKAALAIIGERHPACIGFDALLAAARTRVAAGTDVDDDAAMLRETLVAALRFGLVEVRCDAARFAAQPDARPKASPLARAQLQRGGDLVTSLRPSTVALEDRVLRELVLLLDGSRDRGMLLADLADAMAASGEPLPGDAPGADAAAWRRHLADHLEHNLRMAARVALLVE
nr:class I SAM-dependent methyltransferase [Luteimonas sp. BDR2-5]